MTDTVTPYHLDTVRIAVVADTLAGLVERIDACAKLGLRDVTVTSVPAPGSNVKLRYHLEARLP